MVRFKAEKLNDCVKVDISMHRRVTDEARILIISDVHLDNKNCDRQMLKRHLDKALEIGAPIIDNGDLFDCMGGKYDKRSHKGDVLPQLQVSNYFDALTKYAHDFLKPYAKNFILLAEGNHENSIQARHEINLTTMLIDKLNPDIIYQKYAGWIIFTLRDPGKGNYQQDFQMFRTHGTGGNAPVTKGTIQSARRQDQVLADLYISGHIHTEFTMPRPQWYLTKDGNVKIRTPLHQQIGTYKDSTTGTWEQMKGFAPPSMGGCWLVFKYSNVEQRYKARFEPCE